MRITDRIKHLTVQKKLVFGLSLALSILFAFFASFESYKIREKFSDRSETELQNRVEGIVSTLENAFNINTSFQEHAVDLAGSLMTGRVSLDFRRPLDIIAIDQISKKEHRVRIPSLRVNGKKIFQSEDLINKISANTNTTVTIFQAIPQGLLRIATNIKKKDGSFAYGTYIPKSSGVYKTIMEGKTFLGRAYVVNGWYITGYKPLVSASGEVLGAIYTGLSEKSSLRNFLAETKKKIIGKSGYIFVLDGKGVFQLHPSMEKSLASGELAHAILEKKDGIYYGLFPSGKGDSEQMVIYTKYYQNMNWITAAAIPLSEFNSDSDEILRFMIIGSLVSIIVFTLIFGWIAKGLMGGVVFTLAGATNELAEKASFIRTSNDSLTTRTHSQASAIQESSATVEEITATVKQTADNAEQAFRSSQEAASGAKEGAEISLQVQNAMNTIVESSGKIKDIVSLVEEIAFQTNILAINAAIEAARAGDLGKGFGVVAIEVRDLAQRSADAAKDIRFLIAESIDNVEKGTLLVKENADKLEDIASGVFRVNDLMGEITAASKEQSTALEEINKTIMLLDDNTQKSAAMAIDVSRGGAEMNDNAMKLVQMIKDHFQ